jgi:hypothetical protein
LPPPSNSRRNGRDGPVNRWHRTTGIVAATGLVYLLATGIPLQFSAQFALGQRFVSSDWVLDWYGLQAPDPVTRSGSVVHVGGLLFSARAEHSADVPWGQLDSLAGTVTTDAATIVAGGDRVLVVHSAAPEYPEIIRIDAPILRLGQTQGKFVLATLSGLLAADASLVNWQAFDAGAEPIQWAGVSVLEGSDAERYREAFRARMLNLERWFQDLHSGRFFGPIGMLLIDAVAILLVLLAGTGLILWWRYATRRD